MRACNARVCCSAKASPRTVYAGGSTWSQGGVVAGTVPEPPPPRPSAGGSAAERGAATEGGESLLQVQDWEKRVQAREQEQPQAHKYSEEERRLALELKEKRRMLAARQASIANAQTVPLSSAGAQETPAPTSPISDVSFRTSYPSAMPEFSKANVL